MALMRGGNLTLQDSAVAPCSVGVTNLKSPKSQHENTSKRNYEMFSFSMSNIYIFYKFQTV